VAIAQSGVLKTVDSELCRQSPIQDRVVDLKLRAHGVKHCAVF